MRPLTAESASRPGVYVSVLIVTDPGVNPEDIEEAIQAAADKAMDRFRPPVSADQIAVPYNAQPLTPLGT